MGEESFGREVQKLAALLYADGGLLVSTCMARIQEALEVLMVLFGRVGLQTNMEKAVVIVFQKFRTVGIQSMETYNQNIEGGGIPIGRGRESGAWNVGQS